MGSGIIRRKGSDFGTDWLAEFNSEEPGQSGTAARASDEAARQARLIDLGPEPASHADERQSRLIPLPQVPEPPVAWPVAPPRLGAPSHPGLTVREILVVGIAMVAIFASLIGAALLWDRTEQMVDSTVLLSQAPALPLIDQEDAALEPPSSPIGVPEPPRGDRESDVSPKPTAPVKPQRTVRQVVPPSKTAASARRGAGAMSGAGGISGARGVTAAPSAPTPTPTPTPTPAPKPEAAPPPPVTPPPAALSVGPPVAMSGAPLVTRTDAAAPTAVSERAIKTAAIQSVLDRYRQAFNTLSVDGLGTVWRTVDTKALAKAFAQLEKQTVEFDACKIDITGDLAEASCSGRTTFLPKVGGTSPRVDSRRWTFQLVHVRGGWVIDRVESR